MKWLFVALCAMFFQQSFVTIGKVLPAILAPAIFDDLLINPSWLGVYVAIIAFVALTVQVGCGSVIIRYGSLRVSQISLLSTGIGLALATPGFTYLMILSAVLYGITCLYLEYPSQPKKRHIFNDTRPVYPAPVVRPGKRQKNQLQNIFI